MNAINLLSMKNIITALFVMFLQMQSLFADERLSERVLALRSARESRIEKAIAEANEEYEKAIKNLRAGYSPASPQSKVLQAELGDLAKISVVRVPPVIRLTLPIVSGPQPSEVPVPRAPRIRNDSDLSAFLIGTRWNVYGNGEFMDKPIAELEFTGPESATWSGRSMTWKTLGRDKIWLSGNQSFTFNNSYNEFIGGWIPNSKDKKSGRMIVE
jgi:hypothetical protein